jgi:hypothetical protein
VGNIKRYNQKKKKDKKKQDFINTFMAACNKILHTILKILNIFLYDLRKKTNPTTHTTDTMNKWSKSMIWASKKTRLIQVVIARQTIHHVKMSTQKQNKYMKQALYIEKKELNYICMALKYLHNRCDANQYGMPIRVVQG